MAGNRRWGVSLVVLIVMAGATVVGAGLVTSDDVPPAPVRAASDGYPERNLPCAHAPYSAEGTCPRSDWGPVRDSAPGWLGLTTYSARGYGYRNCTDWVAWRAESQGALPAATRGLGHGGQWADRALAQPLAGRTVSATATVGAAAVVVGGGHVAYVEAVHGNSTITVSEYNAAGDGRYGTWTGHPDDRGFTRFVTFPTTTNGQNP